MSINNQNTYLNIEDAHLRLRTGNVYAQGITIGGITVDPSHGLQRVSDTGNVTSNTLQFANATTAFVTTANVTVGRDLTVTGNATVSSNLTVTGNAVISDDLTVTENLLVSNNLTVTGNTFYTNPASVLVDSNVVAEYTGPHDRPLRKYPEVALTADDNLSTSGYKASVSSLLTGNGAFKAFDATGATSFWHSQYPYYTFVTGTYNPGQSALGTGTPANGTTLPTTELISGHQGEWIKLQMPKKIKLEEVRVYASNRAAAGVNVYQMPKDIAIAGSNDGTNWYPVDSGTLRTGIRESYGMASLPVTTSSYYNYLALIVKTTDNQGANYSAIEIANIEYYGREEGSGSIDTTLKSVYNVPATTGTQLEVYYDAKNYTSGTITDESPNSYVGTLNGNTQLENVNGIKAFKFDGNADNITGTIPGISGEYVHSITFWIKFNDFSTANTGYTLFEMGARSEDDIIGLYAEPGKVNYYFYSNDNSYSLNGVSSGNLIHDQWYHFTATYSGGSDLSNRKLYINGNEISRSTHGGASSGALTLANGNFSIGDIIGGTGLNDFAGSIANFRLYSKALNADQVKELYDYQKDYFLGSKSQLTIYKGHLGVGVTEPSGQLELAGDERIQAYPPRAMTKNETLVEGHGAFVTHGGNSNSAYAPWKAFDKSTSTFWIDTGIGYSDVAPYGALSTHSKTTLYDGSVLVGGWIDLECPYPVKLKRVGTAPRTNYSSIGLQRGIILGSNNGVDWYQIDTIDYAGTTPPNTLTYFDINTDSYYSHFRLVCTNLTARYPASGTSDMHWQMGELVYFGTPGPTTLDKGSLTLGRSLDVPRVSRYDVDTETPRPEKLVVDFDTTVNSSPTDISGQGNHGTFNGGASYSPADKAFNFGTAGDGISTSITNGQGAYVHSVSIWFKADTLANCIWHLGTDGGSAGSDTSSVFVDTNGNFGWFFWANDVSFGGIEISTGTWNHMVCVYDGGTASTSRRLWLNGIERTITSTSGSQINQALSIEANTTLRLASRPANTTVFDGQISNFKLYNVALEPSEVKKLYNLGRTGRSMVISDTAVGIGKVPEAQLDVRGNLNVDGVLTNQQRPAFYVWRDVTGNSVEVKNTTGVITNWDSKRIDTAGTFDLSNGRYYIPVSGLYNFVGAGLYRYNGSGNGVLEVSFYVNGSNVNVRGISYNRGNTTNEHHTVTITFMRFMNAGDYVQMGLHDCQTACDLYYGDGLGYFSGYLLG